MKRKGTFYSSVFVKANQMNIYIYIFELGPVQKSSTLALPISSQPTLLQWQTISTFSYYITVINQHLHITVTHLTTAGQTEQINLLINTLSQHVYIGYFNVMLVLSIETLAPQWKHNNMTGFVFFKLHIRDKGVTNLTHYSHSDCLQACFDSLNIHFFSNTSKSITLSFATGFK